MNNEEIMTSVELEIILKVLKIDNILFWKMIYYQFFEYDKK